MIINILTYTTQHMMFVVCGVDDGVGYGVGSANETHWGLWRIFIEVVLLGPLMVLLMEKTCGFIAGNLLSKSPDA